MRHAGGGFLDHKPLLSRLLSPDLATDLMTHRPLRHGYIDLMTQYPMIQ